MTLRNAEIDSLYLIFRVSVSVIRGFSQLYLIVTLASLLLCFSKLHLYFVGMKLFSLDVGVWSVADNGTVHFLLSLSPLPLSDMASVYFCHFWKSRGQGMQRLWHWFRLGKLCSCLGSCDALAYCHHKSHRTDFSIAFLLVSISCIIMWVPQNNALPDN